MRGPKNVSIAHKKIDTKLLNKRKTGEKSTKVKLKKDSGAPKRPPSAYFVFMEEFRKIYKEKYPDSKSIAAVAKAGGEKWKSLTDSEKAPYVERSLKKKADYEKAMAALKNENGIGAKDENQVTSEKSTSEVNDAGEDEASS